MLLNLCPKHPQFLHLFCLLLKTPQIRISPVIMKHRACRRVVSRLLCSAYKMLSAGNDLPAKHRHHSCLSLLFSYHLSCLVIKSFSLCISFFVFELDFPIPENGETATAHDARRRRYVLAIRGADDSLAPAAPAHGVDVLYLRVGVEGARGRRTAKALSARRRRGRLPCDGGDDARGQRRRELSARRRHGVKNSLATPAATA